MSKIWLVKHTGANISRNLAGYSLGTQGQGWVHPKAVHAFIRKKYAKEWLEERGITHWEILAVDLPTSTKDARKTRSAQ